MRAKNGTRTRDPDLGKVVLYQLSYFRVTGTLLFPGIALQNYNKFFYLQNYLMKIRFFYQIILIFLLTEPFVIRASWALFHCENPGIGIVGAD